MWEWQRIPLRLTWLALGRIASPTTWCTVFRVPRIILRDVWKQITPLQTAAYSSPYGVQKIKLKEKANQKRESARFVAVSLRTVQRVGRKHMAWIPCFFLDAKAEYRKIQECPQGPWSPLLQFRSRVTVRWHIWDAGFASSSLNAVRLFLSIRVGGLSSLMTCLRSFWWITKISRVSWKKHNCPTCGSRSPNRKPIKCIDF